MSEFSHLMKVYAGPMGGISAVKVKCAGTYYGGDALTINYNNQTLIVNMVELEKAIAVVRKYYKKKVE
jgi:hypothetical protein